MARSGYFYMAPGNSMEQAQALIDASVAGVRAAIQAEVNRVEALRVQTDALRAQGCATCAKPGCPEAPYSRGFCRGHYSTLYRWTKLYGEASTDDYVRIFGR